MEMGSAGVSVPLCHVGNSGGSFRYDIGENKILD